MLYYAIGEQQIIVYFIMEKITDSLLLFLQMPITDGRKMLLVLVFAFGAGLLLFSRIRPGIYQKAGFARGMISCVFAAAITVSLAQVMLNVKILSMGYTKFIWGILIASVVILFLYCLIGRVMISVFIGTGFLILLSTANVYINSFRDRILEPVDIFSAGTAMNVAENYSLLPIPSRVLEGWGIYVVMLAVLCCSLRKTKTDLTRKKRLAVLAFCIISSVAIYFYTSNLKTYHWRQEGARFNGYVLDFTSKFKEISASKPENYSVEQIAKLADQYAGDCNGTGDGAAEHPHIIVIMDEAFSDLHAAGEFSTNIEVMPFISSLKENTISGYTLSSVYGGNTANSEYEFLTGNSMAWLSPNVVPYQQYLRSPTYSMVSYLKSSYDYRCIAMHPYRTSGWNRPAAYGYLGFDECYFMDAFPKKNLVRKFVSDQEMFEFLIDMFEKQKENPLFLYGVTMQNHGGYSYTGDHYTKSISINGHDSEFPKTEQYLSLIHETDKAVQYLITYFQNVEEDVIIVFFGDHQPKVEESFYEAISGTTADTLDERQKKFIVPFFIWANYDIEEQYIECTSLNYLSSYVYNAAGIALPPYNRFLQEMEKTIPAVNANGFYSLANECYLPFSEADEEEQKWLETYEELQYNSLFDKRHRNKVLFPALEPE